ncbi:MAG: hypothetical protein RLZZ595_1155, partial [Bacteroidota bacterium]
MKYYFVAIALLSSMFSISQTNVQNKDFFELKVYEYKNSEQEGMIDQFLSQAYLPYLH